MLRRDIKTLPHKERMTAVGKLWAKQKHQPRYKNRPKAPPAPRICPKCNKTFKVKKIAPKLPAGAVDPHAKAKKILRKAAFKPTAYTRFFIKHVKDPKLAKLSPKDRMRAIGPLWQEEKKRLAAAKVKTESAKAPSTVVA
jgi:hypothetical protein